MTAAPDPVLTWFAELWLGRRSEDLRRQIKAHRELRKLGVEVLFCVDPLKEWPTWKEFLDQLDGSGLKVRIANAVQRKLAACPGLSVEDAFTNVMRRWLGIGDLSWRRGREAIEEWRRDLAARRSSSDVHIAVESSHAITRLNKDLRAAKAETEQQRTRAEAAEAEVLELRKQLDAWMREAGLDPSSEQAARERKGGAS